MWSKCVDEDASDGRKDVVSVQSQNYQDAQNVYRSHDRHGLFHYLSDSLDSSEDDDCYDSRYYYAEYRTVYSEYGDLGCS